MPLLVEPGVISCIGDVESVLSGMLELGLFKFGRRHTTLIDCLDRRPDVRKYYAADFGSSPSNLVTFAQSTLEAMPEAIDRLSTYGAVSRRDEMLRG